MPRPALVVLDLVGTTIVDRGEVEEAFRGALAAEGRTLDAAEIAAVRGRHKRAAIASLLAAAPADPAVGRAYARLEEALADLYRERGVITVPGAAKTLAWLRARGIRTALTTGFERALTELALAAARWDSALVDALVCGDDVAQGRPAPYLVFRAMERTATIDVRTVAAVGDTPVDLAAAANAGARWCIGVCSGAAARDVLAACPHTHLLPSIADLPSLWPD